jgi:hypothetical protein
MLQRRNTLYTVFALKFGYNLDGEEATLISAAEDQNTSIRKGQGWVLVTCWLSLTVPYLRLIVLAYENDESQVGGVLKLERKNCDPYLQEAMGSYQSQHRTRHR